MPATKDHHLGRPSGGLVTCSSKIGSDCAVIDSSDNWLFCEIKCGETSLIVGSVYFNRNINVMETFLKFQRVLEDVCNNADGETIIVGGDLNSWVAELNSWPSEALEGTKLAPDRISLHKKKDDRGKLLVEIMESCNFILLNGRVEGDYPGNVTYVSERGVSVVDLVWVSFNDIDLIDSLSVMHDVTLSDHFPVKLSLITSSSTATPIKNNIKKIEKLQWLPDKADEFYLLMERSPLVSADFSLL